MEYKYITEDSIHAHMSVARSEMFKCIELAVETKNCDAYAKVIGMMTSITEWEMEQVKKLKER